MLCSRRAISGPDARIAPWEESAVSKALRAAEGRSNKPVFEPVVGTSFRLLLNFLMKMMSGGIRDKFNIKMGNS